LGYLRRNLGHIERLLGHWPEGTPIPLPRWLLYRYWVIQHVYAQQWDRYGVPEIFNTDQGSQFTSLAFTELLKANGIRISINR
jgi:transposase InsO family protein